MRTEKPTIGCRITQKEMNQIDEVIEQTGESRSQWLYNLIRQELGQKPLETVKGMSDRISALERRFARLLA